MWKIYMSKTQITAPKSKAESVLKQVFFFFNKIY